MKSKSGIVSRQRRLPRARKSEHGRAALVALLVAAIVGAALAYWLLAKRAPGGPSANQSSPGQSKPATSPVSGSSPAPAASTNAETPKTEPGQSATQLIASLSQLQAGKEPLTQERADAWKQTLQQLAQQRAAAVPAIRDFLQKNADITFDSEADRNLVGVPSLRVALLQTLQSIGGPEALAVSLQTLKTAADPAEIATLAMSVEQSEPGKHRDEILGAAREALSQAAAGKLEGRDVAPLMVVLKQFDGPDTPADFQKLCGNWFLYAPMLLAQLPDGAGVPALLAWAKNPDSSSMTGNDMYLRMLAQVASQRPDALDALVEQATANRIPISAWNGIAAALGGSTLDLANPIIGSGSSSASSVNARRFHIAAGNQNFFELPPPEEMTALQAGDRMRMLDRMLSSTTNPTALQALQKVRVEVAARIK
jgi:hypothetical protein